MVNPAEQVLGSISTIKKKTKKHCKPFTMASFSLLPLNEALRSFAAKVLTGDEGKMSPVQDCCNVPAVGEGASVLVGLPLNDWNNPCNAAP